MMELVRRILCRETGLKPEEIGLLSGANALIILLECEMPSQERRDQLVETLQTELADAYINLGVVRFL